MVKWCLILSVLVLSILFDLLFVLFIPLVGSHVTGTFIVWSDGQAWSSLVCSSELHMVVVLWQGVELSDLHLEGGQSVLSC